METAENLCLGFGCRGKGFFAKVSIYFSYVETLFNFVETHVFRRPLAADIYLLRAG